MVTVSVVVPNYNHAQFLPQRIDSILRQTFQDFELILLDDCSSDESRSIISQYARDPRVTIQFNDVNSGSTFKQWNKGVRLARGKYIWIAESDDYADDRLLERLVAALDRDPDATFAYCRSWRVTDDRAHWFGDWHLDLLDPQLWKADFCIDGREHCRKYSLRSPVVANSSAAVFRRTAYDAVGGADESLRLCGDWKVWAAMSLIGKVAFVNETLNYFRYHSSTVRNKTSREAVDVMEILQVLRWILDQVAPTELDVRNACEEAANHWVPTIMSLHFSLDLKLAILKRVRELDPNPIRRIPRPALLTLQRKFARHWRSLRSHFLAAREDMKIRRAR